MPSPEHGPDLNGVLPEATLPRPRSLAVLMTSFNRRESTLESLRALAAQTNIEPLRVEIFLVDDASRDGTTAAVREAFPQVHITSGTGNLFWNRGMHMAFQEALQQGFDYYLWLNDDTLLFPDALQTLLSVSLALEQQGVVSIVTGSTCDPAGKRSYGGIDVEGHWLRSLRPVDPLPDRAVACDTMNGNCTLIPAPIVEAVGNLDPFFHHSFGDLDYGFRARKAGFAIHVAPGFLGSCSDNPRARTWRDRSAPLKMRWQHLNSPKGSPFREWAQYCRRHLGPLWPLYAVSPYVKTVLTGVTR